ncbi:hypothetical protein KM031_20020 (plasmid) [Gemmobacter fulvus]|uniref:Large polyvalent protein-associated domain-containing protein n=1 Tax=Gemmobacter fulvus TaxID=2840474 RepID=A0A975PBF3_9RHOB|nr:hypothetical protein [Gemmobacter fulvus]MBT9247700.1 hypothetical protein [Gemmobacter fulvus]QWK92882.1 hypothetical protein KM031_20020 [Gemmobacter fulvus]
MENDINEGVARPETQRSDAERSATDRPKEYFSVRLTISGAAQEFEDPREAGEAFFRANPAERPSVAHIDGNIARTMARTEIHGTYESGETRYFKSLPNSHAPDAEFRAGFLNAMEASLTERLSKVEWGKDGPAVTERLDTGLRDDLEAFARRAPEKAAALWADHSDAATPDTELRAAVQAREEVADREVAAHQDAPAEKPPIIATGDWVTTDANVELRPVAVATDQGVHTGYEAILPGGENEVTFSERTLPNSREALRHAYDFYEGGEEGLELAVKRAAEMDRDLVEEPDRGPEGLVLEHRPQPEFARAEAAIYAGDDAQLVLSLGRDTENTRDLAERLVADPEFRKVVAEYIPNADATLGTGRFVDGEGSSGFLPDELLAVTSYARDGGAEVLAKFPDEGPLSEALAKHLAQSPVMAAYVEEEQQRSDFASDPERAISAWVAQSTAQIDRLPSDRQDDLRFEMQGIAKEAAAAFGLDRQQVEIEAPPRSTLYSTSIGASALVVDGDETAFQNGSANSLAADLSLNARLSGINSEKLQKRLETGAANAREEESWVKSDITDVAKRHGFDLGNAQGRRSAAERVDRFYERAAELIQSARSIEVARGPDPLVEALGSLARVHASQGSVAFRNENQARDFAEEMKERYGASVLKDIAAGRTEALAKDVPDPAARAAMAVAVVSAAKEHPSLGLSAHEAEAAERRMVAQAASRPPEHARAHAHDRNQDREF